VACGTDVGAAFCFALTEGEVWCWGENTKGGVLGVGDKRKSVDAPEAMVLPEGSTAVQIAAGHAHLLVLCSDGSVLSTGDNPQCGGKKAHSALTAVEALLPAVLAGEPPPSSRGASRGKARAKTPKTPRGGKRGSKGTVEPEPELPPIVPDYKERVVRVLCGPTYSMAVTNTQRLFTWGKGADLVLGHGDNKDSETPRELEFPAAPRPEGEEGEEALTLPTKTVVLDVSAGAAHVIANTSNGTFVWGKAGGGALGLGAEASDAATPALLSDFSARDPALPVSSVVAGGAHSIALVAK
jgi:alpha-tubulin suppressor-like RCC1 family protein